MKLESLLSFLIPKQPALVDAAGANAGGDAVVKTGKAAVQTTSREKQERAAEDTSGNPVDVVEVSIQATYMLAAQQFDPKNMSDTEAKELADMLFDAGAITRRDRTILVQGPSERGLTVDDPTRQRDIIAGFQEQMASGYGESNPQAVNDNSRALTILGRVAAIRERLLAG
ncbi:MAG: hypothetical protein RIM72_15810 [Alphaproteobacteria bacterium]